MFRAAARFDQYVRWSSHSRLFEMLVTGALLYLKCGMIAVAFGLLAVKTLLFLVFWREHARLLTGGFWCA